MKKRIAKLEKIVEVLKKVNCTVSAPRKEKLDELAALYGQYDVYTLCEALEVPRGTLYNHVLRSKRENNSYRARREYLRERIKQIYEDSHQIYGAKKIWAVLRTQGEIVSDKMVAALMQEMNLYSIRTNAKKNYSRLNRKKKDSLQMNFTTSALNQVWVSDTTCFKVENRVHYICAIVDLYSRKVIAHKISQKHSTQLITGTFRRAYANRNPGEGLIFHSDRGSQYTAYAFRRLLSSCNVEQSFSPTGKPCHNAVMESFFSSLKKEEIYRTNYRSVREFEKGIDRYIEFYNTERPHATIEYKTPNAYESLLCRPSA